MSAKKKKTKTKKPVVVVLLLVLAALALVGGKMIYERLEGKERYQLEYQDIIEKNAKEYRLDPYFVAAVINTESGFNKDAVSDAGALGLMQIMPETGQWIAGKFSMDSFQDKQLFDPEINIEFGCWYLHFLEEMFGGNRQLIAAGYNAGHNRVTTWLSDPTISANGLNLDHIPIAETDQYVQKIEKAYQKYKELYEIQ